MRFKENNLIMEQYLKVLDRKHINENRTSYPPDELNQTFAPLGSVDIVDGNTVETNYGTFEMDGIFVAFYNSLFVDNPQWRAGLEAIKKDLIRQGHSVADYMVEDEIYGLEIDDIILDDLVSAAKRHLSNLVAANKSRVTESKKKIPSTGLTKKQKSAVAKKARAGKDIGKKGPGFAKMAKAAGGGEKGKKIAAAAMWKSVKRESAGILSAYEGKKLLNESVSSEQYDEIVSIIHSAIAKAKISKPELSNEIEQVWDVVSDLWADHEMRVYNALMIDQIPEEDPESDPMIPKVEKILQKMTEDLGSEELAVEELSKWDEDEMNEYYSNRVMGEEEDEEENEE
jgi:hypothetical protein